MQILHLDASIHGEKSVSRQLTAALVQALSEAVPQTAVVHRDLVASPIAHLDPAIAAGFRDVVDPPSDAATAAERARSEALVTELLDSDVLVIGAPMYNFSVPSQLKAWIDRIVQPGRTFQYAPTGAIGKATGIRAVIASSRGGVYGPALATLLDFQEDYLRAVLGFIGIRDVRFLRAEGVKGPEGRLSIERALQSAPEVAKSLLESRG